MKVQVLYSPKARSVQQWDVELPQGATVAQAVERTGVQMIDLTVGIWGRKTQMHHVLKEGDRVEIYRALRVDPKTARRERFKQQGTKGAGLFAKVRPGGKAGY